MKGDRLKIQTVIIATFAIFAALWFPVKRHLDGDLQETVVITGHTITAGADIPVRVVVRHRKYGFPVKNAKIRIAILKETENAHYNDPELEGEFTTNTSGTVDAEFNSGEIKPGKYQLSVIVDSSLGHDLLYFSLTVKDADEIFLSADKPRYRPGETVRFRSFLRNSQTSKPIKGKSVTYQITDPKGNIMFRETAISSEFGLSAAKFALSTELNKGEYTLTATSGKALKALHFQVTEYSLPKFKLSLKMKNDSFQPATHLKGIFKAEYFFGKPVSGAKFALSPLLFLIGGKEPVMVNQNRKKCITGVTSSDGTAHFSIEQPPECQNKTGILILKLTVTDSAGNTISRRELVRISNKTLHLVLYPEAGGIITNIENKIYVRTLSDDGTPVSAAITAYAQEKSRRKTFSPATITGPDGIGVISWTPHKQDSKLTIKVSKEGWKSAASPLSPKHGSDQLAPAIIRSDKAVYTADETAEITVLSPKEEGLLFLNAADVRGKISRITLNLASEHPLKASIPLDKFRGLVSLTASIIGKHGELQKSTAYFTVSGKPALTIKPRTEKTTFKPGENVKIHITLKNSDNSPARGAVSVNIIDEKMLTYANRNFFFFPPELSGGLSAKFANLPTTVNIKDIDKIKAAIVFAADIPKSSKKRIKLHLNKLVEKGYLNDAILQDVKEFVRTHQDLSFLSPDLRKIAEMLTNSEDLRTTAVSTAAKKEDIAKHRKEHFIENCITLSIIIIVGCGLVFLSIRYKKSAVTWLVIILIILILASMLLPALSMARESARKISSINNLKQISLALRIAEDEGIDITAPAESNKKKRLELRIRKFFPENLYWNPEEVTDENGNVDLTFPMSDSITSWQGIFDAVDKDGNTASNMMKLKSFTPFFMELDAPRKLTMGDTISIPLTCHNYLGKSSSLTLQIEAVNDKIRCETVTLSIQLKPEEVKTVFLKLHALKPGKGVLRVKATGADAASSDALEHSFRISPSGIEQIKESKGILKEKTEFQLEIPQTRIHGSEKLILRIFPGTFSETVEGLESLIAKPHGCFEQTSSATYPNVMILRYLKKLSKPPAESMKKAENYIKQGYQRLLTFEVPGGGFSLFGNKPADTLLTAYGIMEFSDMTETVFIDKKMIERAKHFLFTQQKANGSWQNNLVRTAYIAWALSESGDRSGELKKALQFLQLAVREDRMTNYTRALTVLALLNINPVDSRGLRLAQQIADSVKFSQNNRAFWEVNGSTAFYSRRRYAKTVVTALSIMALHKAGIGNDIRRKGSYYLLSAGSGKAGWGSTQATLMAIKALLEETASAPLREDSSVTVMKNGKTLRSIMIKKDESDIIRIEDLSNTLRTGANTYTLHVSNNSELGFSLSSSYYLPVGKQSNSDNKIAITVTPESRKVRKGQEVEFIVNLINRADRAIIYPTAVVQIPPGFIVLKSSLQKLLRANIIKKYELRNGKINLYMEALNANSATTIPLLFRAASQGKVSIPPALLYEYYTPSNSAVSQSVIIETI